MKKFSKVLALGLATTMLGGAFVGCAPKEQPKPQVDKPADNGGDTAKQPETEKPAGPVTLKTVSMFGGTDPHAEYYQQLQADFQAANANVTIEDESATADPAWKSAVATDFAAGNEPDVIFYFTEAQAKPLVDSGKVVTIEEIRTVDPEYGTNIADSAYNTAAYIDGVNYAVPVTGFYEALFVNADLLAANNLEMPTDWAKFEAAITGLSAAGITPISVALGDIPHYWIEHLILAAGGADMHSTKDTAAVKDTWVKGLSAFKTLSDMKAFPIDTASTKNDLVQTAFIEKQAGMFLDGSWVIGALKDMADVEVFSVPAMPGSAGDGTEMVAGFTSGYYITKKAWDDPAKRQAAIDYVKYMTSNDAIQLFVDNIGSVPAAPLTPNGLSGLGEKGKVVKEAATKMSAPLDSWFSPTGYKHIISQVPLIAAGKTDAAAVVDEAIRIHNAGE